MVRLLLLMCCLCTFYVSSQHLKTPSEFFGRELGSQFNRHHEVLSYYKYLAATVPYNIQLSSYGTTHENRPLMLAYISSKENIENLETIRQEHLKALHGEGSSDKVIVWFSYNVHGNESVSSEASMKTVHEVLTGKSDYLKSTILIVDPCLNPDGRDRYVNWYNQFKNTPHTQDPNSKEHHEPWLSGRTNHYMFDLNRDWAWLTQLESRLRLKLYNQWMPHIHVDFHEQGVESPYYFAPAAEPYHEVITPFQRDFQETVGKNHARYFDKKGWFYFTKERFDLFYPSYGDTYPMYNGSVGMTYEQGGSGEAGLAVLTQTGDTLTLKKRIAHHHTTGLSTLEVAHKNEAQLNIEFQKFFQNKDYEYKSYVLSGHQDQLKKLAQLLEAHQIEHGLAQPMTIKGLDYKTGTQKTMIVDEKSMVIDTDQPRGTLVKVLFEPNAKLSDSLTYDITAWQLPYAYGLDAIATKTKIPSTALNQVSNIAPKAPHIQKNAYAHILKWNSLSDAQLLADLVKNKVKVRAAKLPFKINGKDFDRGSLIIVSSDNQHIKNFLTLLENISRKHQKSPFPTATGYVDSGRDFGSGYVKMITPPKVAILGGKPTSPLRFGEIWHFFEQQLGYPATILDTNYFDEVALQHYDILILPSGKYGHYLEGIRLANLKKWVQKGGKLIIMGDAIKPLANKEGFGIKTKYKEKEKEALNPLPQRFGEDQRLRLKQSITGAVFKVKIDNTHPLAYGYGQDYFTLKLGTAAYDYLKSGNVAYFESENEPMSGFAGSEAKKKLNKTLVFGVVGSGNGQIVYFVDNPLFRGFWENGKLFFANALFMLN